MCCRGYGIRLGSHLSSPHSHLLLHWLITCITPSFLLERRRCMFCEHVPACPPSIPGLPYTVSLMPTFALYSLHEEYVSFLPASPATRSITPNRQGILGLGPRLSSLPYSPLGSQRWLHRRNVTPSTLCHCHPQRFGSSCLASSAVVTVPFNWSLGTQSAKPSLRLSYFWARRVLRVPQPSAMPSGSPLGSDEWFPPSGSP